MDFKFGDVIYEENDDSSYMYFVKSGEIEVNWCVLLNSCRLY